MDSDLLAQANCKSFPTTPLVVAMSSSTIEEAASLFDSSDPSADLFAGLGGDPDPGSGHGT